eukprot:CAMPEP_0205833768 /NCGR_PEP_ID=MMETSP0206-20130828/50260_1 /ASSEMBLY_ACC=CAM_ASM_000279 /TAXON_ID=36767 /ORGANISM="Euplotes focardii, Strain TN1" /LENGTH=78 /DNA_ID=CAMNT_0053140447 /DNA_START=1062 /DNA_END=1298 /DNA_ORIENTATION=-
MDSRNMTGDLTNRNGTQDGIPAIYNPKGSSRGISAFGGDSKKKLSKFPKKTAFATAPKKLTKASAFKVSKYDANAYNK